MVCGIFFSFLSFSFFFFFFALSMTALRCTTEMMLLLMPGDCVREGKKIGDLGDSEPHKDGDLFHGGLCRVSENLDFSPTLDQV